MTNHAYRQGFEEGWSTGAANPGSPAAAQFRKGRGLDRYFDGHRVADFQDQGVKDEYRNARWEASPQSLARLQQASGAAVSALLKVMIDKTTPAASRVRAADRVLDHASRATALEDIEARITELERAANPSGEGSEGE